MSMSVFPADETTMTNRSKKVVEMFLELMESIRTKPLDEAYKDAWKLGEYVANAGGQFRTRHMMFMIAREMMWSDTKYLPVVSEKPKER